MSVPFVEPLAGDAWRRRAGENDAAYSMRLLAAHRFEFHDLGLRREEAAYAPGALRARLLEIGSSVSAEQPPGQDFVVSTLVKMAADEVAYVPPRITLWAMYGRDPEVGYSQGFSSGGFLVSPLRVHAAVQFIGSDQLLSSEGGKFVAGVLLGAEYLPWAWASTRLQPSLLLRGGWMFSAADSGGFGTCPDPSSKAIGSCSRPMVQGGVAATLIEVVRLQVTGNWYPPIGNGQRQQWSIGPGIGVQWGF
jgi:hypothetical protein